jgi:hypothetical protein
MGAMSSITPIEIHKTFKSTDLGAKKKQALVRRALHEEVKKCFLNPISDIRLRSRLTICFGQMSLVNPVYKRVRQGTMKRRNSFIFI